MDYSIALPGHIPIVKVVMPGNQLLPMYRAGMKKSWAAGSPVDAWDYEQYEHEHRKIFGHSPVIDLTGKTLCVHPLCEKLTRLASGPGVNVDLPFRHMDVDRDTILSYDEEEINPRFRN
jgi:hypothetical protein